MINIYIGNLPYATREDELVDLFSPYGQVASACIIFDRETGRSRGFGFVEMPDDDEARKAVEELAGTPFKGRPLTINEARRGTRKPGEHPVHGGGDGSHQGYANAARTYTPPDTEVGSRGYSNHYHD